MLMRGFKKMELGRPLFLLERTTRELHGRIPGALRRPDWRVAESASKTTPMALGIDCNSQFQLAAFPPASIGDGLAKRKSWPKTRESRHPFHPQSVWMAPHDLTCPKCRKRKPPSRRPRLLRQQPTAQRSVSLGKTWLLLARDSTTSKTLPLRFRRRNSSL